VFFLNVLFILSVLIQLVQITFNITVPKSFWLFHLAQFFCVIVSLIINYYQWQLIPLYIVYFLCLLIVILNKRHNHSTILFVSKLLILVCCWVGLVFTSYSYSIYPLPIITKPTGRYHVGTTTFTLIPPTCHDPINGTEKYKVYIQVWYPAQNNSGQLAKYPNTKELMDNVTKIYDQPTKSYTFLPLNKVDSNSFLNAQFNSKLYDLPLIIYNAASASIVGQNSMLMEELASQGFVVVSVAHFYGNIILFDDGSSNMPPSRAWRRIFNLATSESMRLDKEKLSVVENGQNTIDMDKMNFNKLKGWQTIINDWESDNLCVIGFLSKKTKSADDMFYQKIDLNNIGVIGHSLGGYTAGNLCSHLDEVKACVFFDTIIMSDYFFTDMEKPSLFIYANSSKIINPYIQKNPNSPITVMTLKNANHYSFMEQRLLAPLQISPRKLDFYTTYNALSESYKATTMFLKENLLRDQ
jgi:hypothetical protein